MITTPIARDIQNAILAAVAQVEERFNVKIERAGGRIGFDEATLKFKVTSAAPQAVTARTDSLQRDLQAMGLKPTFMSRGEQFTVVKIVPSRHKFPVLARRADGKMFKFTLGAAR